MSRRLRARNAILLGAALLLGATAPAIAVSQAGPYWGLVLAVAALGFVFFAAGATRLAPPALNWGLGVILAALVLEVGLSPKAISPLVLVEGACLYAGAELGWLAASPPPVLTGARLLLPGLVVLAGLVVGYLALFGLVLPFAGGPLLTVAGVAAAVLIFFLLRGRRAGGSGSSALRHRAMR